MKIKNLLLDEIEYVQFQTEYAAWSQEYFPWPPEDQDLDQSPEDQTHNESGVSSVVKDSVQDSLCSRQ